MMKGFCLWMLLLLSLSSRASSDTEEFFYKSGKIQVVIAVVLIVLLGLLVYLFRLDRKVSQWEEASNRKNS